jgi:hypothetical protein
MLSNRFNFDQEIFVAVKIDITVPSNGDSSALMLPALLAGYHLTTNSSNVDFHLMTVHYWLLAATMQPQHIPYREHHFQQCL